MAKKILKRSLALGALMAFVITGSAMAGTLALESGEVSNTYLGDYKLQDQNVNLTSNAVSPIIGNWYQDRTTVNVADGETLVIVNNANDGHSQGIIQNTDITGNGVIKVIDNYSKSFGASILGTNNNDNKGINITADTIEFVSHGSFAIFVSDNQSKHSLKAREISIDSDGIAVYAANGSVDIKATESLVINAVKRAIRGNVKGEVNIDSAAGSNADIVINGDVDYLNGGIVNIALETEKSELNGTIKPYSEGSEGTVSLGLSDGATWNVTGDSIVTKINANNGNINLGTEAKNISIDTLTGDALNVNTDNTDSSIEVASNQNKKINVVAGQNLAAGITDANQGEKLQNLADVVNVENGNKQKTVTVAAGDVSGAITAVTDGNGKIATVQEEANTTNAAVSDMASISLMTWRQENNDMNKRLGELRDSKGQHGAWARMARGESKYGAQNVKNQYNYYQVGYDEKLSTDPHWTVGVALTRTEGNSTFRDGTGENNHTGVAVYGSYLGDNGSFIDLIAKYARMDNEYKTIGGVGDADYKTNGYSVSAEYGKRFTKDNGLWIEPQVELTYGTVGSVNYLTSKDASVRQDGIDSFVGRIGFALGKNIKAGNVYARASYLYDFDGDTNVTFSKGGVTRSFEQDLGGGWWEVGIGSNINLSDATHLYFDVEKTYGGDVATPWQWNLGVRYSF